MSGDAPGPEEAAAGGVREFPVPAGQDAERVDRALAALAPDVTRRVARTLCQDGCIRVDGRRAAAGDRVRKGQVLQMRIPSTPRLQDAPLRVLESDDELVFVDKPAGLHTVRLRPQDPPTLADLVADRFPECAAIGPAGESGALHRLDRGTSGVVAFARSPWAYATGRAELGTALKMYLAICHRVATPRNATGVGTPPLVPASCRAWAPAAGWQIDAPLLGQGPGGRHVVVHADGRPCTTRVWELADATIDGADACWMLVELVGGRRHQARVHLAEFGRPIVSDAEYAGGFPAPHRPLLHAAALRLDRGHRGAAPQPVGDAAQDDPTAAVEAPLPPDFPSPQ